MGHSPILLALKHIFSQMDFTKYNFLMIKVQIQTHHSNETVSLGASVSGCRPCKIGRQRLRDNSVPPHISLACHAHILQCFPRQKQLPFLEIKGSQTTDCSRPTDEKIPNQLFLKVEFLLTEAKKLRRDRKTSLLLGKHSIRDLGGIFPISVLLSPCLSITHAHRTGKPEGN